MRNIKVIAALFAALWLGVGSQSVFAQANNIARIYFVDVKTGHGPEFEAALKEHVQWRKQAGDPWTWIVHQVVNGENLGDFVIRSGDHTWADLDSYAEFLAKGGEEFNKTVLPHVESISSAITSVDTTNINWYPNNDDVNLISVTTYRLKPGSGQAFTQAVNKIHKAIMENQYETYYAFEWNVNGPAGLAVSLILPCKNWAEMQGPDEALPAFLARVMGPETAQKVFEEFAGTYHSRESLVVQVRRDLSVIPSM